MARTVPEILMHKLPSGITAVCSAPVTAALTNSPTTTAELNIEAFTMGCVRNVTGSAVTVTYWAAMTPGGSAAPLYDEDSVAVTQTLASNSMTALPSAIAGVPHLIPVSDAASDSLIFVFKR